MLHVGYRVRYSLGMVKVCLAEVINLAAVYNICLLLHTMCLQNLATFCHALVSFWFSSVVDCVCEDVHTTFTIASVTGH